MESGDLNKDKQLVVLLVRYRSYNVVPVRSDFPSNSLPSYTYNEVMLAVQLTEQYDIRTIHTSPVRKLHFAINMEQSSRAVSER